MRNDKKEKEELEVFTWNVVAIILFALWLGMVASIFIS